MRIARTYPMYCGHIIQKRDRFSQSGSRLIQRSRSHRRRLKPRMVNMEMHMVQGIPPMQLHMPVVVQAAEAVDCPISGTRLPHKTHLHQRPRA